MTTDALTNKTTNSYEQRQSADDEERLATVTTTNYDARPARLTSTIDPLNQTTATTYDVSGLQLTSTDGAGTRPARSMTLLAAVW